VFDRGWHAVAVPCSSSTYVASKRRRCR
jgi:hypothetical protein